MNWEAAVNMGLLGLLIVVTVAIVRVRDLFLVVLLGGIFSLLMASVFTVLDAVDVAFTEAAVGAGISTILGLATLALIDNRSEKRPAKLQVAPILVAGATCAVLIWAMQDMPPVGDPANPAQNHVGPYYLSQTPVEIDVPNIVTAVLASYRGFDTLGEVAVIFTAGIGVMYLLSVMPVIGYRRRRKNRKGDDA